MVQVGALLTSDWSSLPSRLVAVVSFVFVLLSTIVLVVSTLLEDQHQDTETSCEWGILMCSVTILSIQCINFVQIELSTVIRLHIECLPHV